ncbi:MAG: hypothetical protein FJ320_09130 [SAR202 cluster bacterium]|nr:hypothetical protein [SAR202 cluster bacterium]
MPKLTAAQVEQALAHNGIKISDAKIKKLTALYNQYSPKLDALHDQDLENEEVAGVFSPAWDADEEA